MDLSLCYCEKILFIISSILVKCFTGESCGGGSQPFLTWEPLKQNNVYS